MRLCASCASRASQDRCFFTTWPRSTAFFATGRRAMNRAQRRRAEARARRSLQGYERRLVTAFQAADVANEFRRRVVHAVVAHDPACGIYTESCRCSCVPDISLVPFDGSDGLHGRRAWSGAPELAAMRTSTRAREDGYAEDTLENRGVRFQRAMAADRFPRQRDRGGRIVRASGPRVSQRHHGPTERSARLLRTFRPAEWVLPQDDPRAQQDKSGRQ